MLMAQKEDYARYEGYFIPLSGDSQLRLQVFTALAFRNAIVFW